MKIFRMILAVVFVAGMATGAMGFDGNGSDLPRGIHGNGAGDGTGPIHDMTRGDSVTVSGTVSAVGSYGQGIQIDTGSEIITVYGIGPLFYWEEAGIGRPEVDDDITVDGVTLTFNDGSTKIVAMSVTIGDIVVPLRDEDTGVPLWRQYQKNSGGMMKHEYRKGFRNQNCPVDEDSDAAL